MRADDGLAFLLRYENVAWYESGRVSILDRRAYPAHVTFVVCESPEEVARAIREMVTQSGGPAVAARMGMILAAEQIRGLPRKAALERLAGAAELLSHARPTTSKGMVRVTEDVRGVCAGALESDADPVEAARAFVLSELDHHYSEARTMAGLYVDTLSEKPTIMTQCFAETLIGFILLVAKERGKDISLICPETRPYLQGARLTASVSVDTGVPTTLITDNMPAFVLSTGRVESVVSAADVIALDGHVVNKIGTFQIALAARHFGVPFYVIGNPDASNPTIDTVRIEERNPDETLYAMGVRTAKEGVAGYYPAFDITPPDFIRGIVTRKGIWSPLKLKEW